MSNRKKPHLRSLAIVCLVCTAVVMLLHAFKSFITLEADYKFQQWVSFNRPAKEDGRIALLAIDDESRSLSNVYPNELAESRALQLMQEPWPWSREVYALAADKLLKAGARAVIFDLTFPSQNVGDPAFRNILDRYRDRVVIGFNFPDKSARGSNQSLVQFPTPTLIPTPDHDPRLGFVNVWMKEDEIVRQVWFRRTLLEVMHEPPAPGQEVYESLAARGLRQAGFGDRIPNDTEPRTFRYAFTGKGEQSSMEPHSLCDIFTSLWQGNYHNGEYFKDKIVIIGPWGDWSKDYIPTPMGSIQGVLIHVNAMNALLTGEFLHETPLWMNLLLIAIGGAISWLLGYLVRTPALRAFELILALVGWVLLAVLLYRTGWVILVFSPMLAIGSSAMAFFGVELFTERRERRRIRQILEGYVSKDAVKEIVDNPQSFLTAIGGTRRRMTILFSDIRGFTSITEDADPAKLVTQLNEYLTEMVRIVFSHDGTVDKFIGDAVMAHWGGVANHGESRDACHAVSTALEMLNALDRLNVDWQKRGLFEFRIGIGLNHGDVIFGHLGSDEKHEVTAIGDPVNIASRLQGATKQYHVNLLFGESIAPLVKDRFRLRTVDLIQLKGKSEPVEVFTAVEERAGTPDPEWLADYEAGIQHYRNREFAEAIDRLEKVNAEHPNDALTEEYLQRCRAYVVQAPGPAWNGVFVLTEK